MKKIRACGAKATQHGCLTPHLGITTSLIESRGWEKRRWSTETFNDNIKGSVNPLNPADMTRIHDRASTILRASVDNGLLAGPGAGVTPTPKRYNGF